MSPDNASQRYPVSYFDHHLLNDDTKEYPANFFVRLTFDGKFDRKLFNEAVDLSVARHPLLHSFLDGKPSKPRKSLAFVPGKAKPWVEFAKAGDPYVYPSTETTRFDMARDYGFRLFVHESDTESVLVGQFHHAVADGTAARIFVEDVLGFYEHLEGGKAEEAKVRKLDPSKLDDIDKFHMTPEELKARRGKDISAAKQLVLNYPHPIHSGNKRMRGGSMPAPTAVWGDWDSADFKKIRTAAKAMGGTVNDFLLWNLFLATHEWNKEKGGRKRGNLRIGMAVNMRTKDDLDIPAADLASMYFIDRKGPILDDPKGLFDSLVAETRRVKNEQLGMAFLQLSGMFGKMPGGISIMVKKKPLMPNCQVTTNLSNLGLALNDSPLMHEDGKIRAGSLTLKRFELMPPFRYLTHGSFGVASYDGRMTLTFHYDPRFLSEEMADQFLRHFMDRIMKSSEDS